MKATWNEAEWLSYYGHMRAYNAGQRRGRKPRAPLQYGPHIDSLPHENNEPLQSNRQLVPITEEAHS
jgi:hypothetical protein